MAAQSFAALAENRRDQMFPLLDPADIARMRRFGEPASYKAGQRIFAAGTVAPGLVLVLSGKIAVSQSGLAHNEAIVTHAAGQFMGELAQLSERPSLVNADAAEPVEGFVIRAARLRDLMVQEADLGERIIQA